MAELKSCPFCGRVPKIEDCGDWGYFIICECGIEQSELYKQKCDAVKHWNKRKEAPTKQIKYFDEDEKVWKIGSVIVDE